MKDGIPPMEYDESEKDIGIVIDNKLTFNQHISEKIKTNSIMGVLCRTMGYMDCTTFTLLYTALVKLRLEYANQIFEKKHRIHRKCQRQGSHCRSPMSQFAILFS